MLKKASAMILGILLGVLSVGQVYAAALTRTETPDYESSAEHEYFAIFMDMQMPVLDGVAAAERIRADDRSDSDLPIFAMTANTFATDRQRCREAGMNGYIAKPVRIQDIVDALGSIAQGE